MSDLICITNRKLCSNNFLDQIEMIASAHPKAIVLREKDLSEKEYEQLAILLVYKRLWCIKKYLCTG